MAALTSPTRFFTSKSQQHQILVALVVTKEVFPIAHEKIFSGNNFEGHTIIPVIKDFIGSTASRNSR